VHSAVPPWSPFVTNTALLIDAGRKPLSAAKSEAAGFSTSRQVWVERRRLMETQKAQFGPDGPRSLWRNRIFSAGLSSLYGGVRFFGLDGRGRRNALDVRLVTRSISFPDLPQSFDGYRILHLSDTHLDCLPELATVAAGLLAGIEVDLLALTGTFTGITVRRCPPRLAHSRKLSKGSVSKIAVSPFSVIMTLPIWPRLSRGSASRCS